MSGNLEQTLSYEALKAYIDQLPTKIEGQSEWTPEDYKNLQGLISHLKGLPDQDLINAQHFFYGYISKRINLQNYDPQHEHIYKDELYFYDRILTLLYEIAEPRNLVTFELASLINYPGAGDHLREALFNEEQAKEHKIPVNSYPGKPNPKKLEKSDYQTLGQHHRKIAELSLHHEINKESPDPRRLRSFFEHGRDSVPKISAEDERKLIEQINIKLRNPGTDFIEFSDLMYFIEKEHPGLIYEYINTSEYPRLKQVLELDNDNSKAYLEKLTPEALARLQSDIYQYLYQTNDIVYSSQPISPERIFRLNNKLKGVLTLQVQRDHISPSQKLHTPYLQTLGEKALTEKAVQDYKPFLEALYYAAKAKKSLAPEFAALVRSPLNIKRIFVQETNEKVYKKEVASLLKKFHTHPEKSLCTAHTAHSFMKEFETLKTPEKNTPRHSELKLLVDLLNLLQSTQGKVSFMGGEKPKGLKLAREGKFPHHAAQLLEKIFLNLKTKKTAAETANECRTLLNNNKGPRFLGTRDPSVTEAYAAINTLLTNYLAANQNPSPRSAAESNVTASSISIEGQSPADVPVVTDKIKVLDLLDAPKTSFLFRSDSDLGEAKEDFDCKQ